jgi:zinc protease
MSDFVSIGTRPVQISTHADGIVVSLAVPAEKLVDGVNLAAEIALKPLYDPKQYERARDQTARGREMDLANTSLIADQVLRHVLFGTHPYARTVGTSKQVYATRREDVVALHGRVFDPSRLSILVAGSPRQADVVDALNAAFGGQKVSATPHPLAIAAPSPAALPAARVVLVDKPGNPIAAIDVGALGVMAAAPDSEALHLAVDVLADASLGRLTKRLRDELGQASQLGSFEFGLRAGGYLGFRMRVATENVAASLKEIDRILRSLAADGPTDDEVAALRDRAIFSQAASFETSVEVASVYGGWLLAGQSPDMAISRTQRLTQVTRDTVKAAAGRYLDGDHVRVVVVGDAAALKEPLAALGWGPVELRGSDGGRATAGSPGRGASPKPGVESHSKGR